MSEKKYIWIICWIFFEYERGIEGDHALLISATGAHLILMTGRKVLKIKGLGPVFSAYKNIWAKI